MHTAVRGGVATSLSVMMGGGSVDCEGFGGGLRTHLSDDELCRIGVFFFSCC